MADESVYIDIDLEHIEKAFKKLNLTEAVLAKGLDAGYAELVDKLTDQLIYNLIASGTDSLIKDIEVRILGDSEVLISVNSDHAEYLEYGTGIKGSNNPHPALPSGWNYMNGYLGKSDAGGGWWYKATKGYGFQRVKRGKTTGQLYAYTSGGLPSRKFLYNTRQYGLRNITRIIRKNIRLELKKLQGSL